MVTLNGKRHEAVFRAIADPTRREILGMLRGRPYSVGEIAANFCTSRPAISKHLRMLRAVSDWISDYEAYWGKTLQSLKRYVEDER